MTQLGLKSRPISLKANVHQVIQIVNPLACTIVKKHKNWQLTAEPIYTVTNTIFP